MAYLTKADLETHIYSEILEVISRGNDALINKAITTGLGEAKSYLNRYDLEKMFGSDTTDPTFKDSFLDSVVKDIVCWHLIKLSNPNINLELFRTAYEDATKYLEKVMKGNVDPVWPLRPNDPETPINEAGHTEWTSNKKRQNHY